MLHATKLTAGERALADHAEALASARRTAGEHRADGLAALEGAVDALWSDYLAHLHDGTRGAERALGWVDARMRTDAPELMDLPDFPEPERRRAVRDLHRFNRLLRTYRRALRLAAPALAEARRRTGRTPRLLDLASGHGGFPLSLPRHAAAAGITVDVTGSDIQQAHVDTGTALARRDGVPVRFRIVNGFHMSDVGEGDYDVVTMLQAMHHFTPGQLARMIAEATRVGTTAFVGIDGVRAPWLVPSLPVANLLLSGNRHLAHDGYLSARKMYDRAELVLIARAAAPDARVRCRTHLPGFNALEVTRPG